MNETQILIESILQFLITGALYGVMIFVGADLVLIHTPLTSEARTWTPAANRPILIFFNKARVVLAVFSGVVIIGLWFMIPRTWMGKALRAAANNAEAAIILCALVDLGGIGKVVCRSRSSRHSLPLPQPSGLSKNKNDGLRRFTRRRPYSIQ